MSLTTEIAADAAGAASKLMGLPAQVWGYIIVAVVAVSIVGGFAWHEQGVGEAKCEARVTAAQDEAKKQATAAQAKIDAQAAAHDAGLQAIVLNPTVPLAGCVLTKEELQAMQVKHQ